MEKGKMVTLEEYEKRDGCLGSYEAAAIIKLICVALDKLHSDKIAYRELCPANILLVRGNGGQEEFTEARLAESAAPRQYREGATEDTVLMGIERYAAPEQYGFAQSIPATDIFAVGVIFNEMLTGKLPGEKTAGHPVCACIIEKCCSLDWKKRYKSVAVLLKDIEWYLSHKECGKLAWGVHKNRKIMAAGTVFLTGCACLLLWVGFAMHGIQKDGTDTQAQKAPVQEVENNQEKEQVEEYLKYTVGSGKMVVYYPESFHYSNKTEKESIITVFFAPNTGDTGMLAVAVLDNDWPYSLEEAAEYLLLGISGLYPNGETVTKETGEKQLEVYYKTTVEQKDYIAGIQAKLVQNDEKMIGVLGLYEAEEEKKYGEYMEAMMEKIEY